MSKTYEHYQGAAQHHERAAYQFKEAAKYHQSEEHEKEAHHAYLARAHAHHAATHEVAVARLYLEICDPQATPDRGQSESEIVAA
jgi:hypothetical protein